MKKRTRVAFAMGLGLLAGGLIGGAVLAGAGTHRLLVQKPCGQLSTTECLLQQHSQREVGYFQLLTGSGLMLAGISGGIFARLSAKKKG